MNKTVGKTWKHLHLTKYRQIFVCLLATGICVIIILSFNPGYSKIGGYAMDVKDISPKASEDVMRTERINTTGVVMRTTKNKTTAYVMEVVYGGKRAPLEFDFTASDILDIVKSWRKSSKDMKWKIVDILQILRPVLDKKYKNPCFHKGSQLYCLPYYMLIGEANCGTTEFMGKISQHPNVWKPQGKEPAWFDKRRLTGAPFLKYVKSFSFKGNFSKHRAQSLIVGDGTTNTFTDSNYWMDTPENANFTQPEILIPHLIYHLNPQTKLILILRDPVERLYSAYKYFSNKPKCVYKPTPEDFHERVKYSTRWITQCFHTLSRRHCLYDFPYRNRAGLPKFYGEGNYGHSVHQARKGLYSEYLKDWYSVFPPGQIVVIILEQFSTNQTYWLNKVHRHLELTPSADNLNHTEAPLNANKQYFPPMLAETRDLLQEFYQPFNNVLARMLGKDLSLLWGY